MVKEDDKIKRHIYLQTHLLEFNEHILLYPFSLPLNPKILCSSIIVNECKVMSSKKRPLWLIFKNSDTFGANFTVIFKTGKIYMRVMYIVY